MLSVYLLILRVARGESLSSLMRSSEESASALSETTARLKSVECLLASEAFADQQLAASESPLFGRSEFYLVLQVQIRAFEACLQGKQPLEQVDLKTLVAFPKAKVSLDDSQLFSQMQRAKEDLAEVRNHYDHQTEDQTILGIYMPLWTTLGVALITALVAWNRLKKQK